MRNSTILKWGNNNKNNKLSLASAVGVGSKSNGVKNGNNKNWIHSPDTLLNGHVVYLVKFLGDMEVEQPKGIEVVKQAVQKLKFNHQLKKAESGSSGNKMPKAELTISVNGVTVQEPKTQKVLHEYPLHRISYCADDKDEKRFFSFIAKDAESNRHTCFIFLSDKLAEEITLTIGQAFELAYKKFLESKGKDLESQKQSMVLQKRIEILENENKELKKRLAEVAKIKGEADVQQYLRENNIADLCTVPAPVCSSSSNNSISSSPTPQLEAKQNDNQSDTSSINTNNIKSANELICLDESTTSSQVDFGGITLDNFTLDDLHDDEFDPRAAESSSSQPATPNVAPPPVTTPILAAPPALPPRENMMKSSPPVPENNNNPFMAPVSGSALTSNDPFGMSSFSSAPAIAKPATLTPAIANNPLASFDDLDPFKNI